MTGPARFPGDLCDALEAALGVTVRGATSLHGGMINEAARVDTTGGPVFVKWRPSGAGETLPGLFAAEADGLERLRAAGALRVPQVLAQAETPLPYLVLEYIAPQPIRDERGFAVRFGEALAVLHRDNAAPDSRFGLDHSNYLGSLPQPNTPRSRDWPAFYRDCRLLPQITLARERGLLPPERERLLLAVVDRLDALLGGLDARPALLHGDLWSGNFLVAAGDEPVLIDPAVYFGEREAEIAFVELFGGFPPGLLPAYRAAYPLDDGYERRRALHQLYPLLVHLNHFGEAAYGPRVDAVCRSYVL